MSTTTPSFPVQGFYTQHGTISDAAQALKAAMKAAGLPEQIDTLLVLGSGIEPYRVDPDPHVTVHYETLPHFGPLSVAGHQGRFLIHQRQDDGSGAQTTVALMQGRYHYYEGHPLDRVTFPIRVAAACGARRLVVTNAAGGVNREFAAGSVMLITDHINLMGNNPLIGVGHITPRFVDMSHAYDMDWIDRLKAQAKTVAPDLKLYQGVYCAVSGPSYETPAEIRMLQAIGADAVGMSTVPEVIVARQLGLKVLGLSCITNPAAGLKPDHQLSHDEVLEAGQAISKHLPPLLEAAVFG